MVVPSINMAKWICGGHVSGSVLYCTVLYCSVLYYTLVYCTVVTLDDTREQIILFRQSVREQKPDERSGVELTNGQTTGVFRFLFAARSGYRRHICY